MKAKRMRAMNWMGSANLLSCRSTRWAVSEQMIQSMNSEPIDFWTLLPNLEWRIRRWKLLKLAFLNGYTTWITLTKFFTIVIVMLDFFKKLNWKSLPNVDRLSRKYVSEKLTTLTTDGEFWSDLYRQDGQQQWSLTWTREVQQMKAMRNTAAVNFLRSVTLFLCRSTWEC